MRNSISRTYTRLGISLPILALLVGLVWPGWAFADLLGVEPALPLMNYNNTGKTSYRSNTDTFSVDASPIAVLFPPPRFVFASNNSGPKTVDINIEVDGAGALVGGVPGDDLVVIGAVDTTGDNVLDADGVLLTGEVSAFGFQDSGGPTDFFDFRFTVTGGVLAPFYAGKDIGVTLTSEASSFTGSFAVRFNGQAKGNIGPIEPEPEIEICKLVSITGADPFFDADAIAGDGCDAFDQNIPSGIVDMVDATYRLIVENTGSETLVNARINDPTLGLVDVPVPGGPLAPGDVRVIDTGDAGFSALFFRDRCEGMSGNRNNIARVDADGQDSGIPVSDDDPANVNCFAEPAIDLRKEVSLDGGPFLDANTPATGPSGRIGADAAYRLVVENIGTETLVNAVINDPTLGLVNVPVPGGPLLPGDIRIITQGDFGFGNLFYRDRCDSVGNKLNIARVDAEGENSGGPVQDEDPANVNCEDPRIELLKQVSLTGGAPFFDADNPGDPDVPVGALGADATYRLIVRNIGSETLVNAVINDPTLGLVDVPVPGGPLNPGDERTIDTGDIGFSPLFFADRCDSVGNKSNIARVDAEGQDTGTPVSDDNPANVNCVEADIDLRKQVSLTGGAPFFDADDPSDPDVPVGMLGADATYRLIVENTGSETLINAVINDPTLGLVNVMVPGGPLLPGDIRVITQGDTGFGNLFFVDRCDSVGNKLNIARVDAEGEHSGQPVVDEDPANVNCEVICEIDVVKTCMVEPPPPGADGCTPGYWKQSQHSGSWVGFAPTDDFETVFGVDASFSATLLEALWQGGAGEFALGRHGVAALLNASNPNVEYFTDVAGVIAFVQQAFATGNFEPTKDLLDYENNRGCPLGYDPGNDGISGNLEVTGPMTGTKTCEVPSQGANVRYEYLITNVGAAPAFDVTASDDVLGLLTDPNNPISLAPNESVELSETTFVDQDVTNKVTVAAETQAGAQCMAMDTATVTVLPPVSDDQGCTPGYWKQNQHLDSWVGYAPRDDFEQTFGVDATFSKTLLKALKFAEDDVNPEKQLARHAVAALLNASNPGVDYFATEAEVIALVQDAYAGGDMQATKNLLDLENNRGCPLN